MTTDDTAATVPADTYVTAHQASRMVGVGMHVILTAIRRGKLTSTLRAVRPGEAAVSTDRGVPMHMIRVCDLRRVFKDEEAVKARIADSYVRHGESKSSGYVHTPEELAMRKLRVRLELEREAREAGIGVGDLYD